LSIYSHRLLQFSKVAFLYCNLADVYEASQDMPSLLCVYKAVRGRPGPAAGREGTPEWRCPSPTRIPPAPRSEVPWVGPAGGGGGGGGVAVADGAWQSPISGHCGCASARDDGDGDDDGEGDEDDDDAATKTTMVKTTTTTMTKTTTATTTYPCHPSLDTVEQVGCRGGHAPPLHWYPPRSGGVSYVLSRARCASEVLPPLRKHLHARHLWV
jgi:hypothetical protein